MTGWAWVHLLSAASGLAVALLAVTRGAGSRLSVPMALLGVDQFAWDAASVGAELTDDGRYAYLGAVAAPLFTPVALHFVLLFLGRRRAQRRVLWLAYAVFGVQPLLPLGELFGLWVVPGGLRTMAGLLLVPSVPLAVLALSWVVRHLLSATSSLERLRAGVLLLGLVMVAALLTTDLLRDMGVPVPRLASLGSFSFNVMLTSLVLGLRLFPRGGGRAAAVGQAGLLALFAAVAYLAVFQLAGEQMGVLVTALAAVSLTLAATGSLVVSGAMRAQRGLSRFAILGRFSAQMAHDLKNPLAAARGAADYLTEEMRRRGTREDVDFAALVVQQLDRLGAVIDRYQRLSTLTPERQEVELNGLVQRVLSLQPFAAPGVALTTQLARGPLWLHADQDLLASALENLVKNAVEAMPRGGTLTVATRRDDQVDAGQVVLSVQDTGRGLDARAREQAFELFFTTKATGSGLGLAFVRQVARAHGGEARLTSREGSGTLVELSLPALEKES
jgi:two-component system, NtrC family, sensor histidine kinase HydH